jgi:hypothetical protein
MIVTHKTIPMNIRADWLGARKLTKDKGGLPFHVLHDDCLVRTEKWKKMKELYPVRPRETLVYPNTDGKFEKGRDIVDSETGWVVPWSEIAKLVSPESIIGPKVRLFVDPGIEEENVQVEKYKGKNAVVVHPQSIVSLHPFIQESKTLGKVDEETRVPLEVDLNEQNSQDPELLKNLPDDGCRCLFRIEGTGVRPLARGYFLDDGRRWIVYANSPPNLTFGVAYVEFTVSGLEEMGQLSVTRDSGRLIVEASPEQLTALAELFEQLPQFSK